MVPRRMKPIRCHDGICGALDCPRCYPTSWMIEPCPECEDLGEPDPECPCCHGEGWYDIRERTNDDDRE